MAGHQAANLVVEAVRRGLAHAGPRERAPGVERRDVVVDRLPERDGLRSTAPVLHEETTLGERRYQIEGRLEASVHRVASNDRAKLVAPGEGKIALVQDDELSTR